MTIEIVYRVRKPNGELVGEYMDKKKADAHDQKLDCIYTLASLINNYAEGLDEAIVDKIAEGLVEDKQALMSALKKVKDMPKKEDVEDKSDTSPSKDSNVKAINSTDKVANS